MAPADWGAVLGQVRPSLFLWKSHSTLSYESQEVPYLVEELAHYQEQTLPSAAQGTGALSIIFSSTANSHLLGEVARALNFGACKLSLKILVAWQKQQEKEVQHQRQEERSKVKLHSRSHP